MSDDVDQASFYKLGCELCEKYSTSVIRKHENPLQSFITGAEKSREQRSKLLKNKRTFFGVLLKKTPRKPAELSSCSKNNPSAQSAIAN